MATSSKVKNRWNKDNYDRILLCLPKGEKEIIKKQAMEHGVSMNRYIQIAIIEKMKNDCEKI